MLEKDHQLYNSNCLSKKEVHSWIVHGPNLDLISSVRNFGEYLSAKLRNAVVSIRGKEKKRDESISTSQLRQIFIKMKSIEAKGGFIEKKGSRVMENKTATVEFLMLKPLMAYAKSRQGTTGMMRLVERLDWAIDAVIGASSYEEKQARFKNFCKLFEAILAYHRAFGGK